MKTYRKNIMLRQNKKSKILRAKGNYHDYLVMLISPSLYAQAQHHPQGKN